MAILEEDVASVRAATDFVALASEHMALRRVGTQWTGLCPFHTEKSPSFSLNPELGVYYCFGCGARGDVITFVRELEHLSFVEAVERLATRAGVTLRYDDEATGRGPGTTTASSRRPTRRPPAGTCGPSGATTVTSSATTSWGGHPRAGTSCSGRSSCPDRRWSTPAWPRPTTRGGTSTSSAGGSSSRSSIPAAGPSAPAGGSSPAAAAPSTKTPPAPPSTTRARSSTASTGPKTPSSP